ncbi:hypothetical protein H5S09_04005 [Limosilactobacillus sp. STM2_1]|uniref:Uncharacterized protein n=1 Tax=Limosilactobacillus rudii TaxID=2759755 RepID=A0A7W3UK90_9LACO|nr:hypothetical protein [Limosilactobacillus rudii]MBB1078925.1 hypothetical protein [Limosilactobacillus rudii]MBB1097107.1 hypothetical protein [Limosilactobacillus rudii]MCD7134101.1 hypothetical protein [Limosilactobacillus rudii]
MAKENIEIKLDVDSSQVDISEAKVDSLISKLKEANTLTDVLASKLANLTEKQK